MSWGDFFHMGGYALYVWGSYGMVFGLLAVEVLLVVRRRRTILSQLSRIYKVPPGEGRAREPA